MFKKDTKKLLSKILSVTMLAGIFVMPIGSAREETEVLFSYDVPNSNDWWANPGVENWWGWLGESASILMDYGNSDGSANYVKRHVAAADNGLGTKFSFTGQTIGNGHIRMSGDFRFAGYSNADYTALPDNYVAAPLTFSQSKMPEGYDKVMTVAVKGSKFYAVNDAAKANTSSVWSNTWKDCLVEIGDVDYTSWYTVTVDVDIDDDSSTFDTYTYKIQKYGTDEVYTGGPYRLGTPFNQGSGNHNRYNATSVGYLTWGLISGGSDCAILMDNYLVENVTEVADPTETVTDIFSYNVPDTTEFWNGQNKGDFMWSWSGEASQVYVDYGNSDGANNIVHQLVAPSSSDVSTKLISKTAYSDYGHIRMSGDFRFAGYDADSKSLTSTISDSYVAVPLGFSPRGDANGYDRVMTVVAKGNALYAVNVTDGSLTTAWTVSGEWTAASNRVKICDIDPTKWYTIQIDLNIDGDASTFDTYTYKVKEYGSSTELTGGPYTLGTPFMQGDGGTHNNYALTNIGKLTWGGVKGGSDCALLMDNYLVQSVSGAETDPTPEPSTDPTPTPSTDPTPTPSTDPTPTPEVTKPQKPDYAGAVVWEEDFTSFDTSKYAGEFQQATETVKDGMAKHAIKYNGKNPNIRGYKTELNNAGALHLYSSFMIEEPVGNSYTFMPISFNFDNSRSSVYGQIMTVFVEGGAVYAKNTTTNQTSMTAGADKLCDIEYGAWYNVDVLLNISSSTADKYYYTVTNLKTGDVYTNVGGTACGLGQCYNPWGSDGFKNGSYLKNLSYGISSPGKDTEFTAYIANLALTQAPPVSVTSDVEASQSVAVDSPIELILGEALASSDGISSIVLEIKNSSGEYTGIDIERAYDASAKKITLTGELWYNREYRLTIPGALFTVSGMCIEDKVITFRTENMPKALTVSNIKINGADAPASIPASGTVNVTADFTNIGNKSSQPATLIVAVYDGGVMKAVAFNKKQLALNAAENVNVAFNLPEGLTETASIKIFAWDDFVSQTPMSDVTEIGVTK